MKRRSHSLSFTLATAIALPFALSPTACELIATVDRSKIDQGGGDESGGTGSSAGGMVSSMGGESPGGAGGVTASGGKGSGGKAQGGAGGESPGGAGGESQAGAGGELQGGAGGAGGEAPTSGGTAQASGGKASGGTSQSTGGTASGGTTSGGASSGGALSGGATSGGVSSGGVSSGGASSGGTSGGTASGGTSGGAPTSGGASGGVGGTGGLAGKVIYLTSTPKKANFGGITGADAECNANPPVAGIYKALIVDGSTRVACTTANCTTGGAAEGVGWVLAPGTTYVRPDGTTVIGTTNAAGVFAFPLSAGFGTGGVTYWTGLGNDWTSTDTCTGWTEISGVSARQGAGDALTTDAINVLTLSCADLAGAVFACVQQ